MIKEINLVLSPRDASHEKFYGPQLAKKLGVDGQQITAVEVVRRSVDARHRNVKINMGFRVAIDQPFPVSETPVFEYGNVKDKEEVIVVGAGPAGLFAALRLIELGYRPVVLERGKSVQDRKKDLANLHKYRVVNEHSNYSFGEGGAGTFSDGKLYTRSKKRGNVRRVLEVFHSHGAQDEILIDAHPHIGTDRLPKVIVNIRESILKSGGEVHFSCHVTDLIVDDNTIKGVVTQSGETILGKAVILATGHSARDVYDMLHRKGIEIEAKTLAMGVRIEHPQELIDQIQYHNPKGRGDYLPAASYSFVHQVADRGVYSFCMCPGGVIVPAATGDLQQVVNGMSSSMRNGPYANSGMVVEIRPQDLSGYQKWGPLAGMKFQQDMEAKAFLMGGSNLTAPAQRMGDFVRGRKSGSLPSSSYHPGMVSSALHEWLPSHIGFRLQEGFKAFGRKSRGFLTNEAVILGVESRTSSPIRIPRDVSHLHHVRISGFYPCGEGAGYAGGIVSAAMDGEACAEAFVSWAQNS